MSVPVQRLAFGVPRSAFREGRPDAWRTQKTKPIVPLRISYEP
jgi:hypothetical protein